MLFWVIVIPVVFLGGMIMVAALPSIFWAIIDGLNFLLLGDMEKFISKLAAGSGAMPDSEIKPITEVEQTLTGGGSEVAGMAKFGLRKSLSCEQKLDH